MDDGASQRSLGEEIRELRAIVEGWMAQAAPEGRLDRQARIDAILDSPAPPPRAPRPRRDRHGMHVVRGFALLAVPAVRWLASTRAHRILAGGLIMATATGATLAPDMMAPAPAALVPAHHYHAAAHHHYPAAPVTAPVVPALRKRRRSDNDDTVRPSARVTPAASPSATADPGATPVPRPSVPPPSPAPPPPPEPSPLPTCRHPAGHHCQGVVGEVMGRLWVLRGYHGRPWQVLLRTLVP